MLRFMLILETPAEECHAKNRVDPVGISIIKYLDITNISFRFSASAYAVYIVCLQSLNIGVSFINPCLFITVDI